MAISHALSNEYLLGQSSPLLDYTKRGSSGKQTCWFFRNEVDLLINRLYQWSTQSAILHRHKQRTPGLKNSDISLLPSFKRHSLYNALYNKNTNQKSRQCGHFCYFICVLAEKVLYCALAICQLPFFFVLSLKTKPFSFKDLRSLITV